MKQQEYTKKYSKLEGEALATAFRQDFPTSNSEWECFISDIAFNKADAEEIIYVPEMSYKDLPDDPCVWTKADLVDLCNGSEMLAEYIYDGLTWQSPATYLEELLCNYTDIVIDYNKDNILESEIARTLWEMLSKEEQEQVLKGCK